MEIFKVAQHMHVALLCSEQGIVKGANPVPTAFSAGIQHPFIKKQSYFCKYLFKDLWHLLGQQNLIWY